MDLDTRAFFKTGPQGQVRKVGPTYTLCYCAYSQNTVNTVSLELLGNLGKLPTFPAGNPALHNIWWIKHGVLENDCVTCFYFDGIDWHTHRDSQTQHRHANKHFSTPPLDSWSPPSVIVLWNCSISFSHHTKTSHPTPLYRPVCWHCVVLCFESGHMVGCCFLRGLVVVVGSGHICQLPGHLV